jgi:hypothetical protein
MMVWLPRTDAAGRPSPAPSLTTTATVVVSRPPNGRGKSVKPITDGEVPAASNDTSWYFDWWPIRDSRLEWAEMTFATPSTVSEASIFWFDDTGRGEIRVPASWRLLYRDGASWKPVETTDPYGVAKDRFNRISFTPVTTPALRLEVNMQPTFSAGLQEWSVK